VDVLTEIPLLKKAYLEQFLEINIFFSWDTSEATVSKP
jgi:hypothetical protein